MTSLVAQMVKLLRKMRETQVQSLGWEDLLKKEMATHSSILAWKIPWTEEPGRLQSKGLQTDTTERLHFDFHCVNHLPAKALVSALKKVLDGISHMIKSQINILSSFKSISYSSYEACLSPDLKQVLLLFL